MDEKKKTFAELVKEGYSGFQAFCLMQMRLDAVDDVVESAGVCEDK